MAKAPLKNAFSDATPSAFERAGGNPAIVSALTSMERRAEAIKSRVIAHAKNFEDRWTAREAMQLWQRYLVNQTRQPAPPNTIQEIIPAAVMKTAARQVAARTQLRLARVNAIKTRMGNALIRSLATRSLSQHFGETTQRPEQARRLTMRHKQ
jgi:hypothetical protein